MVACTFRQIRWPLQADGYQQYPRSTATAYSQTICRVCGPIPGTSGKPLVSAAVPGCVGLSGFVVKSYAPEPRVNQHWIDSQCLRRPAADQGCATILLPK